ncbi:MAG: Peptidase associated domain protein [Clostridia bacterium]|jgi:Zn-dependent M16 (insulinase) family peptidase|nr:Peptidase associated domain protein [Clostridia bacterium]
MMNLEVNKIYNGFRLIEETYIKELDGVAQLFEHDKSGAKLIHILNNDENKVFTITFKTPPEDNTGTAHIVEHAVCCSSKKYPLKDTFIEIQKGSLCTALNACTYQDMTMYYCASKNEKDLLNLIQVYMDLVFNPLVTSDDRYFRQEGWHYELRSKKDNITYNGVVYNEMLGEYDDPSAVLEHTIHKSLFPDTVYRYDSGGIPEEIVKLTYNEFLDFYSKYYHPSNACICLYGNAEILSQLELLDKEYLRFFDKKRVEAEITLQQTLSAPITVCEKYSVSEELDVSQKAIFALSFVIGTSENTELRLAFEILEHMLLKSSSSPLVESLIVHNSLGKCIDEGGYDSCRRQPIFSIVLRDACCSQRTYFERAVFQVLEQLAYQGIDQKLLQASISTIEFGLKEAEFPFEPRGVVCSELIENSYLYGGDPFAYLRYEENLEKIKKKAEKGYFEELIKKYFLENTHRVFTVLEPSKTLEEEKQVIREKMLKRYKKSLTTQQIAKLIVDNRELDTMQNSPNLKESLQNLPVLSLDDVCKAAETNILQENTLEGIRVIFNPDDAKDIIYIHLLFDTTAVCEEDIPYIGLLSSLVTYLGTESYTYLEIDQIINTHLGGLGCLINAYANVENESDYKPFFKITGKLLIKELPHFILIMQEVLSSTKFTEQSKIKEIIESIQYELERSFGGAPEYVAAKRLYSYITHAGAYEDLVSGIEYYHFIKHLCDQFDENFKEISDKLCEVYGKIISKSHLTIAVTAEEKNHKTIEEHLSLLIDSLKDKKLNKHIYTLEPTIKNEGYLTINNLQSVVQGVNYKTLGYKCYGSLQVVCHILESTYLWDKVRLQGGAYECNVMVSTDGTLVICSYSDPGLLETLEVYQGIGKFLRTLSLDESELHRYIIGTIGMLDSPISLEQRSERTLTSYLCGITNAMLQKTREEILSTTIEDIWFYADLFDEAVSQNIVCVIGKAEKIKKSKKIFKSILRLP